MKIIDFNNKGFSGFEENEDILIDTGVLLAYYNEFDAYYTTIQQTHKKKHVICLRW